MAPVGSSDSPATGPTGRTSFRVQYRMALALWLLMACWIAMLMAFTWLFWRDGPPAQTGVFGWPLLGLFWFVGLSACVWASSFAMISMQVDDDGVRLCERHPFKVRTTRCGVADIQLSAIVDGVDDEGDPQFRCELRLPDGRAVSLAESHRRLDVVAVRDRVQAALAAAVAH